MKLKKTWIITADKDPITHSGAIREFYREPTEDDIYKFIKDTNCNEYVEVSIVWK